jgi:predicted amidohydrolase YtcJ
MQPQAARGRHDDTIFVNGRILTMAGAAPQYADAVVISKGLIAYVGRKDEAQRRYPAAGSRDLEGLCRGDRSRAAAGCGRARRGAG